MTSIAKTLILITTITVISGEVLDFSINTDRTDIRVPDTPDYVKRDPPYMRRCDGIIGILGCVNIDKSLIDPISSDYYDMMRPKDPSSTNIEYIISKHGSQRERRQALIKTKGSDDEPNAVISPRTRSSSPIRSMIRNRNRRSSLNIMSSNKNPTLDQYPVNSEPSKVSIGKNLVIAFLTSISSPYLLIF